MNTFLGLLFVALLVYLMVALVRWPVARQQGRDFDLRRAKMAGVAVVVVPFVGVAVGGSNTPAASSRVEPNAKGSQQSPPTSTTEPTPDPAAARALEAQREAEREAARQRRLAVAARKAMNREKARAQRAVRERKAANRAKARAQNQARREARAKEQATAEAAASDFAGSPNEGSAGGGTADYAGMNCTEIGHSFAVEPGSDPNHDADNDGIACESQ